MFTIEVPSQNDSVSRITLEGREFYIRFTYNPTYDFWSFGLYTTTLSPILPMTKIVPNVPLLHYYKYTDLPEGIFFCVSNKDRIGKGDFDGKSTAMAYIPSDELDHVWGDKWRTG
jgi:hypothetical protein